MENISVIVFILFISATAAAVWLFFKAACYSRPLIVIISAWIILQSILGVREFYTNWNAVPPRLLFLVAPPVIAIAAVMLTKSGHQFAAGLQMKTLTLLHTIRIPVEITLYYLSVAGIVPESITFEGSNFDIISGISAPIVYYLVFVEKKMSEKMLLFWNIICLLLLLNVVVTALLSAKTPFQQFAFDRPNIGITFFPFIFLPGIIVPVVLLSHLVSIRKLLLNLRQKKVTALIQNT